MAMLLLDGMKFSAHIDYENHIDEGPAICETNNRIEQYAVHIGPGTALAAFPKEYALINDIRPTLVAVHPNAIEIQKIGFWNSTPQLILILHC